MNRLSILKIAIKTALISGLVFGAITGVIAQESQPGAELSSVDAGQFPTVSAFLNVSDANGFPLVGLTAADIEILEDDIAVPPDTISLQSDTGAGSSLVLALDVSVDPAVLTQLKVVMQTFVGALGPQDSVAIVVYHDQVNIVQNFTTDKATLNEAIANLVDQGNSTSLNAGALQAVELFANVDASSKAVIVITNSGDNAAIVSVNRPIDRANELNVQVHTIGFSSNVSNRAQLQNLAALTGGQSSFVDGVSNISAELQPIAATLNQGYRLTYQSTLQIDNNSHNLIVNIVTPAGQQAQAETTFIAESGVIDVTWLPPQTQPLMGIVPLGVQINHTVQIAKVEYLINGIYLTEQSIAPFEFNLDTSVVPPDNYHLIAIATDTEGNRGQTSLVVEFVTPTPINVSVQVNSQAIIGENVTVLAQIDTPVEIASVDFLLDGKLIDTATTFPYSIAMDSDDYEVGTHTIIVRVRDVQGTEAQSAATSFELVAPPYTLWQFVGTYIRSIVGFLLFVMIVATLVSASLLIVSIFKKRARNIRRNFTVELFNGGNVDSQYTLQADEASGDLSFKFALNGRNLHQREEHEAVYETVAAPEGAPVAATPRRARRSAPAPVPVRVQPQPVTATQPKVSGSSMKDMGGKSKAASEGISGALSSLAFLLPGSMGVKARQGSQSVRRAQYLTERPKVEAKRAGTLAGRLSGGKVKVPTSLPDSGDKKPNPLPSEQLQMEQTTQLASSSGSRRSHAAAAYQPEPAATTRTRTKVRQKTRTVVLEWAETPIVPAGENIRINLIIEPVKPLKARTYTFNILSRVAGLDNKPRAVQQSSVQLAPPNWRLRLLPWLTILAAVTVTFALARFILILAELL